MWNSVEFPVKSEIHQWENPQQACFQLHSEEAFPDGLFICFNQEETSEPDNPRQHHASATPAVRAKTRGDGGRDETTAHVCPFSRAGFD